jgi:hypothetical protein
VRRLGKQYARHNGAISDDGSSRPLRVKVLQARLGHSSAKTTLDVYGHLFPDEEDRTKAAIDGALGIPAASARPEDAFDAQKPSSGGV